MEGGPVTDEGMPPQLAQWCDALLSLARDGAWVHCGGRVVYANAALCRLLQRESTEIVGREVYEFIPEELRAGVRARVAQTLATGRVTPVAEFSLLRADASTVDVEAWGHPLPDGASNCVLAWVRPVAQRKEMESALEGARQRLRSTFDALAEGIVVQDAQGSIVEWNVSACRILGLSPDELSGRTSADTRWRAVHEDGSPFPAEEHPAMQTLRSGRPARGVVMGLPQPDGQVRWISINAEPLRDSGQAVTGVVSSFHDITASKAAERELEVERQLSKRIIETAPVGLSFYDEQGQCIAANPAIAAHLGATVPQVLAQNYHRIDSWKRIGLYEMALRAIRGTHPLVMQAHVVTSFGKEVWLELHCCRMDLGGRPGLMLMTRDMTDAKRAEEALERSEVRYRSLVQQASDGIFTAAQDGHYTDVNDAGCRMLGYTREEILRMRMDDLVVAEDQHELPLRYDELRSGQTVLSERRLKRKDGSLMLAEISGRQLPNGEYLGIVRDIGPRMAAEEALRAKAVAERANAAKSEFISRMSHELRTPLNAILGFSELLLVQNRPSGADDTWQRHLQLIRRAGQHLLTLIDDLLDLSRIEAGVLALHIDDLDAREAVHEVVSQLGPEAQRAGVRLSLEMQSNDMPLVRGDATRLREVLTNLVSNAIKYNRPGGTVLVRLLHQADRRVRLSVIDDGPGMTTAQQAQLFQPFNRLGAEATGVQGTGIGLVIARSLVQLMGGQLVVHSEPGRGSEFTVELQPSPLPAESRPEGGADDTRAMRPVRRDDVHGRVLYIEDDEVNRLLLEAYLSLRPGVQLLQAVDGASGLRLAVQSRPDLVLVDMALPDMSGLEVVQALRAQPGLEQVPCIALSASAMPHEIARARAVGLDGYLTKPLSAAQLLSTLDSLLAPR